MNRESIITIKRVLNVTDLAGEKVMVDFENGKYFMIKGVGNDIWDMLEENITVEKIITSLMAEYDVTEEVCEQEVLKFLNSLESIGIIGEA